MKYLSMFSGCGMFEYAIQSVYPDAECVGFSEIDKHATAVYQYHYPHKRLGDATKINTDELSDFDLLVGGFPCQAFSLAGQRKGFDDTRGTLFFEAARVLEAKKPRYFLLENVKGLVSHDNYRTLATIYRVLTDLDYEVQHVVLNSRGYGVPQNRERIFIIGNLRTGRRPEILSIGESFTGAVEGGNNHRDAIAFAQRGRENGQELEFSKGDYTNTLTSVQKDNLILQRGRGNNKGGLHSDCPTISANSWQDNNHLVEVIQKDYTKGNSQGARVYDPKGGAVTLSAQGGGMGAKTGLYEIASRVRRLTPIECERLMGLPDNYTQYGNYDGVVKEVSDSQRYKLCGNGVVTEVVKDLIKIFEF